MSNTPNIVIIMTDQQRADHCRREGFPLDTTPFLDQLASQGTWFDRAYTSMPVCAPARVSMLTGRYPSAHRVRTNHNIEDAYYTDDLFDVFRGKGYATALVGKNHSHLASDKADFWYTCGHLGIGHSHRNDQEKAFDDWLKTTHFQISVDAAPFPVKCQIPYRLVSTAQKWLESLEGRPFLMWLSFPEPHNPYQVPEPYYSMFPPDSLPEPQAGAEYLDAKGFKYQFCRESFPKAYPDFVEQLSRARANYMGMLRLLDDQVERFVEFLEEKGLREDTIIVFVSDHGDFVGDYGLMRKGPELPEALARIPMLVTGPGVKQDAKPHPAHVSITDIMPTLCEAAGIALPDGVQGRSLWPLLTGQSYPKQEFASAYAEHGFGGLYYTRCDELDQLQDGLTPATDEEWGFFDCLNSWTQSGQMRMIRKGDWKLTFDMQGSARLHALRQAQDDLTQRPPEIANLYAEPENAAKRQELLEDLLTWRLRVEDPLPLPRRRYVMKRDSRGYWTPYSST